MKTMFVAKLYKNHTIKYDGGSSVTVPLPAATNIAIALDISETTKVELVYERTYWSSYKYLDFNYASQSAIFALDRDMEEKQKNAILEAKNNHNSVGGVVSLRISNVPVGLGEPIYDKLDSKLADAMMSINAVKGVEIGDAIKSVEMTGYENNDQISNNKFLSNNSGGILGGISNGEDVEMEIYFKPTPSIFQTQKTINTNHEEVDFSLKGRHDPIVAIRGSVVTEAMAGCVIVDMLLLNMTRTMNNLKKIY